MTAIAWQRHQEAEAAYWGDCRDTWGEERKHPVYAARMGLAFPPDVAGRSVLDLGGGPVSMLLRASGVSRATVVDPCPYPDWVRERYARAGIHALRMPAEEYVADTPFDECWLYNVLQHVIDPWEVVRVARASARLVRLFEWIDVPPSIGHPHTLHRELLDLWLGGHGTVEPLDEHGCVGLAYYGVF